MWMARVMVWQMNWGSGKEVGKRFSKGKAMVKLQMKRKSVCVK
jgi:hypothetical protein